jgi:enamine deaminase RidA (YjgF/YER057c/UK114 family)
MGHTIIRPYNTRDTHPDEPNVSYDNDLCQALRAGDQVFLRGQVGATFDGAIVGLGDAEAQADQAMDNVKQLLEEAGAGLADVVKMRSAGGCAACTIAPPGSPWPAWRGPNGWWRST